jgi:hypothetical protein
MSIELVRVLRILCSFIPLFFEKNPRNSLYIFLWTIRI